MHDPFYSTVVDAVEAWKSFKIVVMTRILHSTLSFLGLVNFDDYEGRSPCAIVELEFTSLMLKIW